MARWSGPAPGGDGIFVGRYPDDPGAAIDFAVSAIDGVGGVQPGAVYGGKACEIRSTDAERLRSRLSSARHLTIAEAKAGLRRAVFPARRALPYHYGGICRRPDG
jgi:hypothetical protein